MTLSPDMQDALRHMRSGSLAEATAAIQRNLGLSPIAQPRQWTAAPVPAAKEVPSDGFQQRKYQGSEGVLGYRLHVPQGAGSGLPLVVMLHGCTQSPEDFARGTAMNRLADELGFIVAYPGQTPKANAQKCWNWFRPEDQRRGSGEPALIAGMTRALVSELKCDPTRVYVAGLSAGGAAAAILGVAYPDIFAAIGVHSGLACGAAHDMPSAFAAMHGGGGASKAAADFVPVITFHGDRDATVSIGNAQRIADDALRAAGNLEKLQDRNTGPGGRSYSRMRASGPDGRTMVEQWTIHGAGHAWSGGQAAGSYTDATGPDASREMMRFFLQHRLTAVKTG